MKPTLDGAVPFGWKQRLIAAVLLVLLVGLAYHAALENGFHFDDTDNILQHAPVHMSELSLEALYRAATQGFLPQRVIPNLSFAIDWWRGEGDAAPFQATNVAIHAATALAVMWLLQMVLQLTGSSARESWILAGCAAALWALHPIQVQAVTYVVQRMTAFSALFTVLAVSAYVKGRCSGRLIRWLPLTGLAGVAAWLSKENAYILPVLLLLAEYTLCRHPEERFRRNVDRLVLAVPVVAVAYAALDLSLLHGPVWSYVIPGYEHRDFTLGERLLTQPRVIFLHLGQILLPLPARFSIEHDIVLSRTLLTPWTTLPALAALVMLIAASAWIALRTRFAAAGFFLLWIPVTLAIESSVIPLEIVFEHRMYLPSLGLAGLAALGLRTLGRSRGMTVAIALSAAIAALLLTSTAIRVPHWRTSVSLYEQATTVAPNSPRAWTNLATAYEGEDRGAEAIDAYSRAIGLNPEHAIAYLNRGSSHRKSGNVDVAEADYRQFLRLRPRDFRGPYVLGSLLNEAGRIEEAESWLRQAIRLDERNPLPQRELGRLYLNAGLPAQALAALDRARDLAPRIADAEFYADLGVAYARLNRFPDAINAFHAALERQPDAHLTRVNLAFAFLRNGELHEALTTFDAALAQEPDAAHAHLGRSEALARLSRKDEALGAALKARALEPDNARANHLVQLLGGAPAK